MGVRDGGVRLAIANLPCLGAFFHSCCHNFAVVLFTLLLAFAIVVLKGIWHPSEVASFARVSALSFPGISQWLGHHETETDKFG